MENQNELHSYTFRREDWELIMAALRALSVGDIQGAHEVGLDSVYANVLIDRAHHLSALASDIEFKLPE
jgi:hypothetical protein